MNKKARGYIASGIFNGHRVPQHLQNQIVKNFCDTKDLVFVLSRAEYWINGSTQCQLWAALTEGYQHIVFFSLWQLPNSNIERERIYQHCSIHEIVLHFATERMSIHPSQTSVEDVEMLFRSELLMQSKSDKDYLELLSKLI